MLNKNHCDINQYNPSYEISTFTPYEDNSLQ